MIEVPRVTPKEIRPRIEAGDAVLVCAYEDDDRYSKHRLEGAISYIEFVARQPQINKEREIVFYCA